MVLQEVLLRKKDVFVLRALSLFPEERVVKRGLAGRVEWSPVVFLSFALNMGLTDVRDRGEFAAVQTVLSSGFLCRAVELT